MKQARIVSETIVEIVTAVAGHDLSDCYHPDVIAGLVEVPDNAECGWVRTGGSWSAPPFEEGARRRTLAAIEGRLAELAQFGAAYEGRRIAIDDASLSRLAAMAAVAQSAAGLAVEWPAGYSAGWIAIDNSRIALPTAADGLALATAAIGYAASLRQHARDLKDMALAAGDEVALAAIDITAGWPA